MDHFGHVAGHAGRRDETVEALGFEPLERLRQLLAHEFFQLFQHSLGRRRAFEELIGEPDRAQLEALGLQQLITVAGYDLDRSTADVDRERRLLRHGHAVLDAQEDQSGFLFAADDPNPETRLLPDQIDDIAAVLGFAYGTGRHSDDAVVAL